MKNFLKLWGKRALKCEEYKDLPQELKVYKFLSNSLYEGKEQMKGAEGGGRELFYGFSFDEKCDVLEFSWFFF